MTANNNSEVSAYWTSPNREVLFAFQGSNLHQFKSLEELYAHGDAAGWDTYNFPQGSELPMLAVGVTDEEIDEAIGDQDHEEVVDLKTEAFSFLVVAQSYCVEKNYDAAIEYALDAVQILRTLKEEQIAEQAPTTAFLMVKYDKDVATRYRLTWDDKQQWFNTWPSLVRHVIANNLEVEPFGGPFPVRSDPFSGMKSGDFPPDEALWAKLQEALQG